MSTVPALLYFCFRLASSLFVYFMMLELSLELRCMWNGRAPIYYCVVVIPWSNICEPNCRLDVFYDLFDMLLFTATVVKF